MKRPPTLLGFFLHPLRLALLNENRHCDYRSIVLVVAGAYILFRYNVVAWSGRHGYRMNR